MKEFDYSQLPSNPHVMARWKEVREILGKQNKCQCNHCTWRLLWKLVKGDRDYVEVEDGDDFEDVTPVIVKTGLTSSEGATELHIYYKNNTTYVVTSGEFNNAGPSKTAGIVSPEDVLSDYLDELEEFRD